MPIALKCPACNAPLTAPEGRGQFYCQYCGTPVVIPEQPQVIEREESVSVEDLKKGVTVPEKLRVDDWGHELVLSWKWYSHAVWFLLPFCIAWNAFLIGWYTIAISMPGDIPFVFRIIMFLFPVAHVAVGAGLAYGCLTMLLNWTRIRVTAGNLSVKHGPIPFIGGNDSIPVEEIDQLYVKHDRSVSKKDGPSHTYPLCVVMRSGREIQILPKNTEVDLARAIEKLVEERLGIRDEAVTGEYRD